MGNPIKKLLQGTPLFRPARAAYQPIYRTVRAARRVILQVDKSVASEHLSGPGIKKLHLGCGNHILNGWLNTDFFPYTEDVMRLDVTARFPFDDGTFDYVFSEHMIEHIPHAQGQRMINESFRVLKPGGRIRITTPDLAFLVALYQPQKIELQARYIRWSAEANKTNVPFAVDTYVINNFVRDWGHQFIYDEKALRGCFERAGFQDIVRCALNDSSFEALRNLENETKIPEGFVKLESFTLEGTKKA
ncbi:MAG TPA: methyltransferase domain-containing protein [Verrucomicrobiae bacterium]|nr:methyltransferase domain-containing protein [Verrucomicrobiae bacterium]